MNKLMLTTLCALPFAVAACDTGPDGPTDTQTREMLERVIPELDDYEAAVSEGVDPSNGAPEFIVAPDEPQALWCDPQTYVDYCFGTSGVFNYEGQCLGLNQFVPGWCIIADPSLPCFGDAIACSST